MDNKNKPLRVAQILGKMDGGGTEQVVMNYYRSIDRERVQYDFFAFMNSKHIPAEEIKSLGGGLYLLCGFRMPFRYVRTLARLLKENHYDIVHCHLGVHSFLPLLAAKKAGVPVRIIHSSRTSGGMREPLRSALKALLKPLAGLHATERFACSELSARWLFGKKPVCEIDDDNAPQCAVRILRNAVDTKQFAFDSAKRTKLRGEFKVPSNALLFVHVGRFCPQKNQQFLIDIFSEIVKQHPNSRLIMVGEGGDMEVIQARIIKAGLLAKAFFAGRRSDVDAFYSAADCLLLPSLYEGVPLVGIEAQCAGLSCLFSDKIPPEAAITASARFLSLKTPAEDWAFAAIQCARLRRHSAAAQIAEACRDIGAEAEKLCSYYIKKHSELHNAAPHN